MGRHDKMEEEKNTQTSAEETEETTEEQSTEGTEGESEGTSGNDGDTEGEGKEVDYKTKFSESSKEALRLLNEKKAIEGELGEVREKLSKLEAEREELTRERESEDPDQARINKLERNIGELSKEILSSKQEREYLEFAKSVPEAETVKDALKRLHSISPKKSFSDLWNENFKALADKVGTAAVEKQKSVKKSQVASGKGSTSSDPLSVDIDTEAFNKLSIAQRKEILKKRGF
jgi:predicted RNase H-like nuclease (RuvC/YqgF family)